MAITIVHTISGLTDLNPVAELARRQVVAQAEASFGGTLVTSADSERDDETASKITNKYDEIFEIEVDGWCYGLANFKGEIQPAVVFRVVGELGVSFRAAIENGYVFDVNNVTERIFRAGGCRVGEREIAFAILAQLDRPSNLDEYQQSIMAKVVDQVEQRYGGALERLQKKWIWEQRQAVERSKKRDQEETSREVGDSLADKPKRSMTPTVFLAHSSRDKPFVRQVEERLKAGGIDIWLDEQAMLPGDPVILHIRAGIRAAQYLLVFVSTHSGDSEWVKQEVREALRGQGNSDSKVIIPLVLDDAPIPDWLSGLSYVDFRDSSRFDASVDRILEMINLSFNTRTVFGNAKVNPSLEVGESLTPASWSFPEGWMSWPDPELISAVGTLEETHLSFGQAQGSARKWWQAFRSEQQPRIVFFVAGELAKRGASIEEFFLTYVYSNTDAIEANLHYLDYLRSKKRFERKRSEKKDSAACLPTGVEGDADAPNSPVGEKAAPSPIEKP